MKFRWSSDEQRREFELVEKPLVPELAMIERAAGCAITDLTPVEQLTASTLISLRRAGVALTWEDILAIPPVDFEVIEDQADEQGEVDPQAPGIEAGTELEPWAEQD